MRSANGGRVTSETCICSCRFDCTSVCHLLPSPSPRHTTPDSNTVVYCDPLHCQHPKQSHQRTGPVHTRPRHTATHLWHIVPRSPYSCSTAPNTSDQSPARTSDLAWVILRPGHHVTATTGKAATLCGTTCYHMQTKLPSSISCTPRKLPDTVNYCKLSVTVQHARKMAGYSNRSPRAQRLRRQQWRGGWWPRRWQWWRRWRWRWLRDMIRCHHRPSNTYSRGQKQVDALGFTTTKPAQDSIHR